MRGEKTEVLHGVRRHERLMGLDLQAEGASWGQMADPFSFPVARV
jgi:hypothetical protein